MANIGDDCHYFLYSSCSRGMTCRFRHVEAARHATDVCMDWKQGICKKINCASLHHTPESDAKMVSAPPLCKYETLPSGCTDHYCRFTHVRKTGHKSHLGELSNHSIHNNNTNSNMNNSSNHHDFASNLLNTPKNTQPMTVSLSVASSNLDNHSGLSKPTTEENIAKKPFKSETSGKSDPLESKIEQLISISNNNMESGNNLSVQQQPLLQQQKQQTQPQPQPKQLQQGSLGTTTVGLASIPVKTTGKKKSLVKLSSASSSDNEEYRFKKLGDIKPSGPVNFEVKSFEQIMKEKRDKMERVKEDEKKSFQMEISSDKKDASVPAAVAAQSDVRASPSRTLQRKNAPENPGAQKSDKEKAVIVKPSPLPLSTGKPATTAAEIVIKSFEEIMEEKRIAKLKSQQGKEMDPKKNEPSSSSSSQAAALQTISGAQVKRTSTDAFPTPLLKKNEASSLHNDTSNSTKVAKVDEEVKATTPILKQTKPPATLAKSEKSPQVKLLNGAQINGATSMQASLAVPPTVISPPHAASNSGDKVALSQKNSPSSASPPQPTLLHQYSIDLDEFDKELEEVSMLI